jgi:hypothetical protein
MREHAPEAAQRGRGKAETQGRNVALQVSANEFSTPALAGGFVAGKLRTGKAATTP